MLVREAKWFAQQIQQLGDEALFPMLNLGSHTEEFRCREQPWIDRYIFAPIRQRGQKVVHLDLREAPGVDLVGDLTEPAFLQTVSQMRFRSLICSNLLEHVPNPGEIAAAAVAAIEPGGYLLVSCPRNFPYHPDPLDTLFRPDVNELSGLFPGTEQVSGLLLPSGTLTSYFWAKATADPAALIRNLWRRKTQAIASTEAGLSAWAWLPWLFRTFYQTCVVLRKTTQSCAINFWGTGFGGNLSIGFSSLI